MEASKISRRSLALVSAIVLVIGCQTTHPAAKSGQEPKGQQAAQAQQSSSGQQAASGLQSSGQAEGQVENTAQGQQQSGRLRLVFSARPRGQGTVARAAARFVNAVINDLDNLFGRVKSFFLRPQFGRSFRSALRGIRLPSTDLLVPILAGVILVGGGAWTLATRIAGRRRG